eukprot:CAMPEP_0172576020 /NCGR_PEP_ID=MMETSP1067-20121228/137512_1 /TAXON_ID=265564 ORGANISM="Thalassiosira punctigera, Strain Tpunct2005C2" /NCGR_SAMPLE_ID=MMETSP1067 /ASSEMBLY_ACC=CAM_ASM_000444 /LENGTH=40 /DNA_ID= /DNA_START= /DNA_END= /DNA_ORIENTATION=
MAGGTQMNQSITSFSPTHLFHGVKKDIGFWVVIEKVLWVR